MTISILDVNIITISIIAKLTNSKITKQRCKIRQKAINLNIFELIDRN